MDGTKLALEIDRIANLPEVEHEPEIDSLWECCKAEGYTQRKPVLRKLVEQRVTAVRQAQAQDFLEEELKKANDEFFVVSSGGKVSIGSFTTKEVNRHTQRELELKSRSNFELWVENRPSPVRNKKFADWWLAEPGRAQYTGFTTDPNGGEVVDGKLNLWRGFGVTPVEGDVSIFLEFVGAVLAAGNQKVADYILNWLAWTVQNPGKLTGVVLGLVSSREGTGKGTLGNTMVSLFGSHGVRVGKSEQMTGKHNKQLLDALFVFCDEALFAGSKKDADTLKGYITEPTITIEPKFVDGFEVANRMSIMMATNHDWAANVGWSDRRYAIYEVSDHLATDTAYWNALHGWLDNGGKEAVLHYLQNRDVSGWDARRDREKTRVYIAQKLATLHGPYKWWRNVVSAQSLSVGKGAKQSPLIIPSTGRVPKSDVYDEYAAWARVNEPHGAVDQSAFWKAVYQVSGNTVVDKQPGRGTGRIRYAEFPIDAGYNVNWALLEGELTKWLSS